MKEITCTELKKMKDAKEDFQLIDVREDYERDIASIGGELIPMGEVMTNLDKISRDKKVVFYCRTGNRSGVITQALEAQGFTNVFNLKGGIHRWADEIDAAITKY
ncbi:MAG: rhodanese-like domain-containing protein [Bacteroidetes bacterium]|nr:rhodanese-like domain-containing protein [Bacteroidota bacterium]